MDNSEIKTQIYRGGAPVGYLSELNQLEQNATASEKDQNSYAIGTKIVF